MNPRELFLITSDDVNGVAVLTKNRPGVYLQVKPSPGLIVKVFLEIIGSPRGTQKLAL